MEDPATFAVWATVSPSHIAEAQQYLHQAQSELTRLQVLQAIARAVAGETPLLLHVNQGWLAASALVVQPPPGFREVQLYQNGYGPDDRARLHWCPTHELYYGGIFGCPVCRGDYQA